MPAPWKKNLLKVPPHLQAKIAEMPGDECVVAAIKKIPEADIREGKYAHLNFRMVADGLEWPESVLPPADSGRWSRTNLDGKEFRRKDLPMVTKTFAVESPNFGDAATYGTHTNYFDRKVYQIDLISPKYLRIIINVLDEHGNKNEKFYVVKFEVEGVITRNAADFDADLLYALNILQENTGAADVFPSDMRVEDYLATVQVDWEIFPPGERNADIRRILGNVRSKKTQDVVSNRYDVLRRLEPINIIRGTSGFQRYFGAQFADDLVVFENLQYGNALYVMYENWRELSQKSRLELLAGNREGFERILHTAGWEVQLRFVVKNHRGEALD